MYIYAYLYTQATEKLGIPISVIIRVRDLQNMKIYNY
jgi:hypothetical protein